MGLRVLAYCAASFVEATRRIAGVEPLTCPPITAVTFLPSCLRNLDLVYFDLHGAPGEDCWYGDDGHVALSAANLAGARLAGAVIVATNCYLADADSPMLDALLDGGASYVIGGAGPNYANRITVAGAGLLALWMRRLMELGFGPLHALKWAKQRVRIELLNPSAKLREAAADTLEFRAFVKRGHAAAKGSDGATGEQ